MKKKWLLILTVVVLMLSIALTAVACNNDNDENGNGTIGTPDGDPIDPPVDQDITLTIDNLRQHAMKSSVMDLTMQDVVSGGTPDHYLFLFNEKGFVWNIDNLAENMDGEPFGFEERNGKFYKYSKDKKGFYKNEITAEEYEMAKLSQINFGLMFLNASADMWDFNNGVYTVKENMFEEYSQTMVGDFDGWELTAEILKDFNIRVKIVDNSSFEVAYSVEGEEMKAIFSQVGQNVELGLTDEMINSPVAKTIDFYFFNGKNSFDMRGSVNVRENDTEKQVKEIIGNFLNNISGNPDLPCYLDKEFASLFDDYTFDGLTSDVTELYVEYYAVENPPIPSEKDYYEIQITRIDDQGNKYESKIGKIHINDFPEKAELLIRDMIENKDNRNQTLYTDLECTKPYDFSTNGLTMGRINNLLYKGV